MINDFKNWCIQQHDVVCNQKYAGRLPYSMHLRWVDAQAKKFLNLLPVGDDKRLYALYAVWGHDLIEDARVTYNDIKEFQRDIPLDAVDTISGEIIAEIVFLCTENKGRNRSERHNDVYYHQMATNEVAIFVKLCDIMANVTFSLLENNSMYGKYKAEYPKMKGILYKEKFKPMFDYLEKLLNIN